MRLAVYALTSVALAAGCLIRAFDQRPNYYSATVYLSQSNACILILTNLALVCIISFIYGLQRLVYGQLRAIEIEQLSEKAWYAVLDTLFAMPSLRDDIGSWLLVAFTLLLAGKVWAWIAEGRIDTLEQQPPADARRYHLRLSIALAISIAFDILMCRYCFQSVMQDPRPGMMVIFAFEYAILAIYSSFLCGRYLLTCYEARITAAQIILKKEERKAEIKEERRRALREAGQDEAAAVEPTDDDVDENEIDVPGWEEKRRYLFGLELATDAIKILIYSVFFAISLTFIGFPMHAMRDAYLTVSAFTKRIQDYANYRRATDDMNTRYTDATTEDLSNDNTCIVCREAMVPWQPAEPAAGAEQARPRPMNEGLRAKKLPCGHILHLRCLKAWLERQQSCPTCRRPVIATPAPGGPGALGAPALGAAAPGGNAAPGGGDGAPRNRLAGLAQMQHEAERERAAGIRGLPMRWLNLGPIRVGFYNGGAGRVNRALEGEARRTATTEIVDGLSAHDLLRRAEMRLLHDAHNLDVDRAHLLNVRALEAELARLRTLRTTSDPATWFSEQGQQASASGVTDQPAAAPQAPGPAPATATATQQYQLVVDPSSGAVQLPPGFTVPEGWTLTPLHRIGGAPSLLPQSQPSTAPAPQAATPSMPAPSVDPVVANADSAATVPVGQAAAPADQVMPSEIAETPTTAPEPIVQETSNDIATDHIQSTPTWSFPAATDTENLQESSATNGSSSNGAANIDTGETSSTNTNGQAEPSSDTGKARSVAIEDASDDGNA